MTRKQRRLQRAQLLTAKPVLYVCNVDEGDAAERQRAVARGCSRRPRPKARSAVVVSAAIEAEIATMPADERDAFLAEIGLARNRPHPRHPRRLRAARPHHLLHRRPQGSARLDGAQGRQGAARPPARSTPISSAASSAPRPSPMTISSRSAAKPAPATPASCAPEGKEYVVQDGDVLLFRFNV